MKFVRYIFLAGLFLIFYILGNAAYRAGHHLWRMNHLRQGEQAARKADPIAHLAALKNIPILLLHGSADSTVPASANSQRVAAQLPVTYRVAFGGEHGDARCLDAATILNFLRHSVAPGAPVMCLHACGGSSRDWQTPKTLSRATLVTALNQAGYPTFADSYGDTWGNDHAVAQLDHVIGKRRVVLLGESMGGLLALRYAEAHPAQTLAIVGIYPACSLTDMMSRSTAMAEGIRAAYAP